MHDRPIIALDFPTQKEVAVFLENSLRKKPCLLKWGWNFLRRRTSDCSLA